MINDTSLAVTSAPSPITAVLFIDSRVPDLQMLINAATPDTRVVILQSDQDGVAQMAQALHGLTGLASISVLSHGNAGMLLLGDGPLYAGNLQAHSADLACIGLTLASGGDLLLYGCNVGAGDSGAQFVADLASLTGADVAASSNNTGGINANGGSGSSADWALEVTRGNIDQAPVLDTQSLSHYDHLLVAPTVTSVTSSTANGTYKVGDAISIQVNFSAVVNVGGGTPSLTLETGSIDRAATYTGGTGSSTLSFSYTVQTGDTSADLDQIASSALHLNGASIQDAALTNAVLTLAAPGAAGSLGANAAIVIDGVAPHGALPVFASASTNPYGLANVGNYASPSLVDIDGDGDLDALIGNFSGNTVVQLNTGSASSPAFAAPSTNPYGLADVGFFASPSLVDIDGDGDLDALIGNSAGNTLVQLNTGSASSPAFAAPSTNPYGLANVSFYASPSFVDIDGDGDLDALIGNLTGNTVVQLNTGSASSPAFAAPSTNPYGLANVGLYASPSLVDIDGDGDLDALIGNSSGNTVVQLNTGSASSPAFAAPSTNPYGLANVSIFASPSLVDIDGDGDLDAFIGNFSGNTVVQLNTPVAPVTSSTANGT